MKRITRGIQAKTVAAALLMSAVLVVPATTFAAKACGAKDQHPYTPSIELGCLSKGNPVMDLLFAVIRFLTIGVGLVLVASTVYAGIQYISSRGDPNATTQAINRIRANVIALLVFVFAYAILNYIVPGQVLK